MTALVRLAQNNIGHTNISLQPTIMYLYAIPNTPISFVSDKIINYRSCFLITSLLKGALFYHDLN